MGIPRDRRWVIIPALCFALAAVAALFGGLLWVAELPGVRSTAFLALYLCITGVAVALLPRYQLDACQYMVTDRHVIWRRGKLVRAMQCRAITYARVHWHRSAAGVGHLELVRAVPFGPLVRKQRLMLHNVEAPDRLFALIRNAEPAQYAGYSDVRITDRLDRGENVVWGASPAGWRIGQSEALTAALGLLVLVVGALYGHRMGRVLLALEEGGLPVQSWTWCMLSSAMLISAAIILSTGAFLAWKGLWGARTDGSKTEYVLTENRLIIRRARTELSVDRRHIVDLADVPSTSGSRNLYLILDGPWSRALDDNGVLSTFSSGPRGNVPPVLYEVRDAELLRNLLFGHKAEPVEPLKAA